MELSENAIQSTRLYESDKLLDYSEILNESGLKYIHSQYYWQVGQVSKFEGWVLYLSTVKAEVLELLAVILPLLKETSTPFKLIRDSQLAAWSLDGGLGSDFMAKLIYIYPLNDDQAIYLATKFVDLTKAMKSPQIPGALHIGGAVYSELLPFSQKPSRRWPFADLNSQEIPTRSSLLNYKYYPVSTIKKDAKGDVIKALYFKSLFQIRSCIIKQGRKAMFCDNLKRDIKDRLLWQEDLTQHLSKDIAIPKILDSFEQAGDYYVVFEFINGKSLTEIYNNYAQHSTWYNLSSELRIKLIDYLLEIVAITEKLHRKGYIHRDITPENFLLDKNGKIWLIDLELMWSAKNQKPNPPFGLGTPGFISPEQSKVLKPTPAEDVYALGAFFTQIFTNIHPSKLLSSSADAQYKALSFFIQNTAIANLITQCLDPKPLNRPAVATLSKELQHYKENINLGQNASQKDVFKENIPLDNKWLKNTIQAAIDGLSNENLLRPGSSWLSLVENGENEFGNDQMGTTMYTGWAKGVAGPLWLVALAKECELGIEPCMSPFNLGWEYLDSHFFQLSMPSGGLYAGGAGIALAIVQAYKNRLLDTPDMSSLLKRCFVVDTKDLSLRNGLAGIGLSLLTAQQYIDRDFVDSTLASIINSIITQQKKDGSWEMAVDQKKGYNNNLSLDIGTPGITWFLLNYLQRYNDQAVGTCTVKALSWLLKAASSKKENDYIWPVINGSRTSTLVSTNKGLPGITLVLIKAFEVLKDDSYRRIAEANMRALPGELMIMDFTLGEGLAGIGEVYLEAAKILKNAKWQKKAEWIAKAFMHTFQADDHSDGHWVPQRNTVYTSDLFTGCSGIIHFLMRCLYQDKLDHPLTP